MRSAWILLTGLAISAAQAQEGELELDLFALRGVAPGDTLTIDDQQGQLLEVEDGHYLFRPWNGQGWDEPVPGRIADLDPLGFGRAWLIERRHATLSEGDLVLEVRRRRAPDGLQLDLQLVHSHPRAFLLGLDMRLRLEQVGSDAWARELELVLDTPPLFAGELHELPHALDDAQAHEADLAGLTARVLPFHDPAAKELLLALLAGEADPDRRERTIRAAALSRDADLLRLLVGWSHQHADEPDGARAQQALAESGPELLELLVDDLDAPDASLPRVRWRAGRLERGLQARAELSQPYRATLIDLIATSSHSWRARHREALFASYASHPELRSGVRAAFASRPADAVACLLSRAVAFPSDEAGDLASALLSELDSVAPAVRLGLAGRGLFLGGDPEQSVAVLLGEARQLQRKTWEAARARERERVVLQAERYLETDRAREAVDSLRRITSGLPGHHPAFPLLARGLVFLAAEDQRAGRRSEAGETLREALRRAPRPEDEREARARLAELHLEVAREELSRLVVRESPGPLAQVLEAAAPGERVETQPLPQQLDWVAVRRGDGTAGYMRRACLDPTAPGRLHEATPAGVIERILDEVVGLDRGREAEANALRQELLLREAHAAAGRAEYASVLRHLEAAEALGPVASAEALRWEAWFQLNGAMLLTLASLLVALGALAVYAWRTRDLDPLPVSPPQPASTPPTQG